MRTGMSTLIITGLLVITAIALLMTIFISLHKFSSAYQGAIDDRFYFAMGEAVKPLKAEMQLGQPVDKLSSAQKTIEKLKAIDKDIISVEIFDQKGRTIYSTDNSYLFGLIPDRWETAWKSSTEAKWQVKDDKSHALGFKLTNSLDQAVGSLVLLYSPAIEKRAFAQIKNTLFGHALWLGGAASLILCLVIYRLSRRFKQKLHDLESDLQTPENPTGPARDFKLACQSAHADFNKLEDTLHKIDEGQL